MYSTASFQLGLTKICQMKQNEIGRSHKVRWYTLFSLKLNQLHIFIDTINRKMEGRLIHIIMILLQ